MSAFNADATTSPKLSLPKPVVTPSKKTRAKQHIADVDGPPAVQALVPRKRRSSQSTELPVKISTETTKNRSNTNKNSFPSTNTTSDIAVIGSDNESEDALSDTKMAATSDSTLSSLTPTPITNSTTTPHIPTLPNLSVAMVPRAATAPAVARDSPAIAMPPPISLRNTKKKKMIDASSSTIEPPPVVKKKIYYSPKAPKIRAIIIGDSTVRTTVVFRTELPDKASCWCDRRLEEENNIENGWCRQLGMVPNWNRKHNMKNYCLEYHIDGIPIIVGGTYTSRLFTVVINAPYNLDLVIDTARTICDTLITTFPTDFHLIALDPPNLLWSSEPAFWSDILSTHQTFQLLLHNTMTYPNKPTQGFFETFQEIIFDHYENGTFNQYLKTVLFAPESVLHEDVLSAITPTNASN